MRAPTDLFPQPASTDPCTVAQRRSPTGDAFCNEWRIRFTG